MSCTLDFDRLIIRADQYNSMRNMKIVIKIIEPALKKK